MTLIGLPALTLEDQSRVIAYSLETLLFLRSPRNNLLSLAPQLMQNTVLWLPLAQNSLSFDISFRISVFLILKLLNFTMITKLLFT
jgi:hypothetical protein